MTRELVELERARFSRARRAMPVLWGVVVLFGVVTGMKLYAAWRVASSFGMSGGEAMHLLLMRNSERMRRTFLGHEAVFVDYATSAFVGAASTCLVILLLGLRARALRREAALLDYVSALEHEVEGRKRE